MPRSRLLIALLPVWAAAALSACGGTVPEAEPDKPPPVAATPPSETESAEPPPDTGGFSETTETAIATTVAEPEPDGGPELRPPPIVLVSEAGRQEAVQGSYCITKVSASGEGEGVCADTGFPHPEQVSLVRPGEEVTIEIVGATIVDRPEGCSPACPSIVTVYPLGCGPEQAVADFELTGAATTWKVDLEAGAYELAVFAYFDAGDEGTGDTSGGLGLRVDPDREAAVKPVDPALAVCPLPEQP
jgi:hypothetical protein